MAGLPGVQSILGNVPGATGSKGAQRTKRPAGQQQPQQQATPQASTGAAPTFAQLQQSGQARPAPPRPQAPPQQPMNPQGPPQSGGPSPIQGQLNSSISNSLANPNPYNSDTVQQINAALTGQTNQEFGAQKKQLEENLASRGLSASTIGGGYYGDLAGQQDQALANMRANLVGQSANGQLQGTAQAQGAAQNAINSSNQLGLSQQQLALQSQLGLGNLNLGQQQLNQSGSQFGQTLDFQKLQNSQNYGLNQQQLALQSQLGLGNLALGQGDLSLRQQQTGNQNNQFYAGLGQNYDLANMQNQTQNRGLDITQQGQQNQYTLGLINSGGGYGSNYYGTTGTNGVSTNSQPTSGSTYNNYQTAPSTAGYQYSTAAGGAGIQAPPGKSVQDFIDQVVLKGAPDQVRSRTDMTKLAQQVAQDPRYQQWSGAGNTTVNFGGNQYTPQQFQQLQYTQPGLFGPQNGGGSTGGVAPNPYAGGSSSRSNYAPSNSPAYSMSPTSQSRPALNPQQQNVASSLGLNDPNTQSTSSSSPNDFSGIHNIDDYWNQTGAGASRYQSLPNGQVQDRALTQWNGIANTTDPTTKNTYASLFGNQDFLGSVQGAQGAYDQDQTYAKTHGGYDMPGYGGLGNGGPNAQAIRQLPDGTFVDAQGRPVRQGGTA